MLESAKSRDELFKISRNGQDIMNKIERSRKPIVAAIAGSCLGGGFEVSVAESEPLLLIDGTVQVALACHYRIAMNDKRTGFGVPEIKLGLLPGAGGTQRLVEKLALPDVLDMILTGKEVKAKKAKSMGLVDAIVEPIGPGMQETEEKNIDYLRTVAVQKAKCVDTRPLMTFTSRFSPGNSPYRSLPRSSLVSWRVSPLPTARQLAFILTLAHVRYQIANHVDFLRSKLYLLASEIQGDVTNARSLSGTVESARRMYFARWR